MNSYCQWTFKALLESFKLSLFSCSCFLKEMFLNTIETFFLSRFCYYILYNQKQSYEFWLKFYDSSVGRK